MIRVLVSAASRHGATAEIGEAIATALRESGLDAQFRPPERVAVTSDYDAFVLGSAVYAGHWLPDAIDLCDRIGPDLKGRPVWLFSSGPVGPEDSKLVKKMWTYPVDLEQVRERPGRSSTACSRAGSSAPSSVAPNARPSSSSNASTATSAIGRR